MELGLAEIPSHGSGLQASSKIMCILPCFLVDQQIDHSRWFFDEDGGLQKSTIFDIRGEDPAANSMFSQVLCVSMACCPLQNAPRRLSCIFPLGDDISRLFSGMASWDAMGLSQMLTLGFGDSTTNELNHQIAIWILDYCHLWTPPNFMGHQFGDSKTPWIFLKKNTGLWPYEII